MPGSNGLLPADAVVPDYEGGSLLNVPPTVGTLLGIDDGWAAPPLGARHALAGERAERVVVLVLDGVGWNRYRAQMARDDGGLGELLGSYAGRESDLTSVSPATTSVATTCLAGNGAAPAESGMLGYSQRLPRLGVVANMLFWRPMWSAGARTGELERWGLEPEAFLPTPSIFQTLAAGGAGNAVFLPRPLASTPLSRLQMRGADVHDTVNFVDALEQLGSWLTDTSGRRGYAYVYLPDFDTLSHRDGPEAPAWGPLFASVTGALERFLRHLGPAARRGTRLLVTADHGHVHTPREARRTWQHLTTLEPLQALRPGGEARHLYLYARAGAAGELREAAAAALGDAFTVLAGHEALDGGLYGDPSRLHPEAEVRLGDVVVLARGGASVWDDEHDAVLLGMHGALESDEMRVPLLSLRLDA